MPKVHEIQTKISTKFFDRAGSKSPTEIKSLSNKLYDESSTNSVKLGNTSNYVNVPYSSTVVPTVSTKYTSPLPTKKISKQAFGPKNIKVTPKIERYYFDFNGDPNTSNRQTRMHAINSYLNSDGNNHKSPASGMATSGTYNLFWGSKYANSQHLSGAEKPSKEALGYIQDNTKANALYDVLWSNNYTVNFDSSSKTIQIGDNTVPQLPACIVNKTTKINEIKPTDWDEKTGFALGYQTNASYHSQAALENHFMRSRSKLGFARALAEGQLTEQSQKVQDYLKNDNTQIPEILSHMDKKSLQKIFEKPDVLSRLPDTDFIVLLDQLPTNAERIKLYRLLQPTNISAPNVADTYNISGKDIVDFFVIKDITNEILANSFLKTPFINIISNCSKDDFINFLKSMGAPIIDEIADAYTKYMQGSDNAATADNYRKALKKTEIAELSSDYAEIVEQASSELAGIAVHKFKSLGKVYVPDYTTAANTNFKNMDVKVLASWRNKNLQNMAEFEDNLPKLRIDEDPFNYS